MSHENWRFNRNDQGTSTLLRLVKLGGLGLLAIACLAIFIWTIYSPFRHNNAHLLLVSGERPAISELNDATSLANLDLFLSPAERTRPAKDFIAEDLNSLLSLNKQLYQRPGNKKHSITGDFRELADLRRLRATLEEMSTGDFDVVILYLATRVYVQDADIYLDWDLDTNLIPDGQNRFLDFVGKLSAINAAAKILIVDGGIFERDPWNGTLINEFPKLLERGIQETGDPKLWVLASNQPVEQSHISRSLERSIFGFFVASGLNGAADLNQNRMIDLNEFSRFVCMSVSSFVQQSTNGLETQTPVLLWGGGRIQPDADFPVLLPALPMGSRQLGLTQALESATRESRAVLFRNLQSAPLEITNSVTSRMAVPNPTISLPNISLQPAPASTIQVLPDASKLLSSVSVKSTGKQSNATASSGGNTKGSEPNAPAKGDALAKSTDSSSGSAAAEEDSAILEALLDAWKLRDQLLEPESIAGIGTFAAADWNLIQERLLLQERLFRAGKVGDTKDIGTVVRTIRDGFEALLNRERFKFVPGYDSRSVTIIQQIHDQLAKNPVARIHPSSFGLLELSDRQSLKSPYADWKEILGQFDALLESGSEEAFSEWLSKLPGDRNGMVEIRLAQQLNKLSDISWSAKRYTLAIRKIAEKLASVHLRAHEWFGEEFSRADRLRTSGERILLDQVGRTRESAAINLLQQADYQYRQLASDLETLLSTEAAAEELTRRFPQYVAWNSYATRSAKGFPANAIIGRLGEQLTQFATVLNEPTPNRMSEVRRLQAELGLSRAKIEEGLEPAFIATLNRRPVMPEATAMMEAILSTPLPRSSIRGSLWKSLVDTDRAVVAQIDPQIDFSKREPIHQLSAAEWEWIIGKFDGELSLAKLCSGTLPAEFRPRVERLERSWGELRAEMLRFRNSPPTHDPDEALWKGYHKFADSLVQFYQSLQRQIELALAATDDLKMDDRRELELKSLRAICRCGMLWGHRMFPKGQGNPAILVKQCELRDFLVWQTGRIEKEKDFAPQSDAAYLTRLFQSYDEQISALPNQPKIVHESSSKLEWHGPESLSNLSTVQDVELKLDWTGSVKTPVWASIVYDPEIIELQFLSDLKNQFQLGAAFSDPEIDLSKPPTWTLPPGASQTLKLRVRSLENSAHSTRLIVRASTSESTSRKDISLALPRPSSIDLVLNGIPGTSAVADEQLNIYPFPNRETQFELGLINGNKRERRISLRCLAPQKGLPVNIPKDEISATKLAELTAAIGPADLLAELPEIKLPGDTSLVRVPFPKPAEQPAPPAAAEGRGTQAGTDGDGEKNLAPYGLLFVITDLESERSAIRHLSIASQRPRRFLKSSVKYDAKRQQIEIVVEPRERSLIPSSAIKVAANLIDATTRASVGRLESEIAGPDFRARMLAGAAPDPDKMVDVMIHVDGYPRAFTYHVPCFDDQDRLLEDIEAANVRVISPKPGQAFQSPLETISAVVQVDAPNSAFQLPDDVIQMGIDRDNDRDFRDEPCVYLRTDRQVVVKNLRFAPEGNMSINMGVSDFHLKLPTMGLRESRSQVLARLNVGGRDTWSDPVPVIFDSTPPTIRRVIYSPAGKVAIGKDLAIAIDVSDEFSGVARVELATSPTNSAVIEEGATLIPALLAPNGQWGAKFPTANLKPGPNVLLVRAADQVGNLSEPTVVNLFAVTAEEATAAQAAMTVSVSGVVIYGDLPIPGIRVSAELADHPEVAPAITNDQGVFQLSGLTAGKWKIAAKGVFRNKVRKGQLEVEIKPPAAPKLLKMQVK